MKKHKYDWWIAAGIIGAPTTALLIVVVQAAIHIPVVGVALSTFTLSVVIPSALIRVATGKWWWQK